ncbi:MAG: Fe-S cluster assembly protein SufD [Tenuifilaceae bacterium]|mgnify:CR=1 FL=1|jgi:Fe-S cluster assembly protein SufD|nr:Fe-S cluster assembly protein SufD [Bacteroidales bacterium]MDI9517406.1 Fe-S cluster assembly protein SufD [Bacteroidota bacterium]NLH56622.1 Fe-S cluster assembly protein SufD [Rikenellaceae bacterium]OQC61425.1 MAG: FeS cluster assembly protein SufD [Bacteroidetes bacterium ADurb.Bin008]HNV80257.1 Fe-S cluster assembly protein SufD [Tenuifilaceae bacterium]
MKPTVNISPKEDFINLYLDNLDLITENSSGVLNAVRQSALENFKLLGFPGLKNEKYKYMKVEAFFTGDYEKYFTPKRITFNVDDIFRCDIPSLDTHLALTLNGFYLSNPHPISEFENGVIVGSLAEAAKKYPNVVGKYYNSLSGNDADDGLVALNTAFAQDGVFIYIPKGVRVDKPVQIINLLMSDEQQLVQYRNLIIAEEGSQVEIAICDHTLSPEKFLSNVVTEIFTNGNASIDLVCMQNQHNDTAQFTHIFGQQEKDSKLVTNTISLHGGTIRNNINILLNGEGSESHTYGLSLVDRTQHVDMYSFIEHAKPNCTSFEQYKAILDDQATGAFNGRILVRKDAQKTQAFQSNNNLLLTADARMFTKPQLEIYADDVKCSHGATVGQLDLEAKFYMQSRGISEREAKLLLMFGFAHDVVGHIKIEALRDRIDELVNKRLRGELSRCHNCPMHCY